MQYTFLEGANAIWHRVRAWPIAINSPIPPVNSPLYPKGPTAWASVAYYNAPNMDFSPSPRLLAFQPGHVLTLGGDQYRIHRKLRGQAVSTVWLAEHTVRGASRRRFVALETFDRIFSTSTALQVRAEPRSPTTDLNYIRNIIASQDRGLPGAEHCDRLRAVFLPDRHLYAVKDPTGPTVWDLQLTQPNLSFSLAVTKRIIGDTLRALQYVHSFGRAAVGVASHNLLVTQQCSQDSMSANIVQFLQSHPPEMVDPSANRKKSSSTSGTSDTSTQISPSPKTKSSTPSKGNGKSPATPLATKASAPPKPKSLATVLKAQPLPAFGLSPSLDNIQVRLTRCEHATLDKQLLQTHAKEGNKPARLIDYYHSELKLCSPEALRGAPERWSPPVNIWAIGHLAFQFLTGHYIYGLRANPEVEGPALPSWLELVLISHPRTRMLEERLRAFAHATAGMSADDVRATCAFIGRCLEMDPAKRATAAELLQDEWFR